MAPVAGRFLPTRFSIPSCIWQQVGLKKYLVIERANGSLYSFVIFLFKRDLKEVVRYTAYSIQSCLVLDFKDRTRFAEIAGLDLHLLKLHNISSHAKLKSVAWDQALTAASLWQSCLCP